MSKPLVAMHLIADFVKHKGVSPRMSQTLALRMTYRNSPAIALTMARRQVMKKGPLLRKILSGVYRLGGIKGVMVSSAMAVVVSSFSDSRGAESDEGAGHQSGSEEHGEGQAGEGGRW